MVEIKDKHKIYFPNITEKDLLIPDKMPQWWKQMKKDRLKRRYEYCKKIFSEE